MKLLSKYVCTYAYVLTHILHNYIHTHIEVRCSYVVVIRSYYYIGKAANNEIAMYIHAYCTYYDNVQYLMYIYLMYFVIACSTGKQG